MDINELFIKYQDSTGGKFADYSDISIHLKTLMVSVLLFILLAMLLRKFSEKNASDINKLISRETYLTKKIDSGSMAIDEMKEEKNTLKKELSRKMKINRIFDMKILNSLYATSIVFIFIVVSKYLLINSNYEADIKNDFINYIVDGYEEQNTEKIYSLEKTDLNSYKLGYFEELDRYKEINYIGDIKFIKEDEIRYETFNLLTVKDLKGTTLNRRDLNNINKKLLKKNILYVGNSFKEDLLSGELIIIKNREEN